MKIARKISLALLAVVVVVAVAFAAVRVQRERRMFDEDIRRDHERIAVVLAAKLSGHAGAEELVVASSNEATPSVLVRVVAVAQGSTEGPKPLAASTELAEVEPGEVAHFATVLPSGESRLLTYFPLAGRPGWALEISEPESAKHRYVERTLATTAIAIAIMVLSAGGLAVLLGSWVVARPVGELIEGARRLGAGDLSARVHLTPDNELGELAAALNSMASELESARKQVKDESRARAETLEQLRHTDRLATVGRLASAIAHELGTPLNVASGHAKLIATGRAQGEGATRSAVTIGEQCQRMTRIIRQVLQHSRRSPAQKIPVPASQIVREAVGWLAPLAEGRGVPLSVHPNTEAHFEVDPTRLQQVLINLVLNAVQASTSGSPVTVTVDALDAAPANVAIDGRVIRIAVRDRGSGMTSEVIGRVFEPFFTTKESGAGTGLGLSIARDIVTDHGGWITVSSEPGTGTCFEVFLPACTPPSDGAVSSAPSGGADDDLGGREHEGEQGLRPPAEGMPATAMSAVAEARALLLVGA